MMAGAWSYEVTELLTGRRVFDHLPLTDVTFTDSLNGSGALSAQLSYESAAVLGIVDIRDWLTKVVIWPCRDGQPWGAYLLMSAPSTDLQSPRMSLSAQRFDVVFDDRPIEADLVYTQVDQLDIFKDLMRYGCGLGASETDTPVPGTAVWCASAQIPWIQFGGAASSGVLRDRTKVVNGQDDDGYRYRARKPVGAALRALAELHDGFEYRWDYIRNTGVNAPYPGVQCTLGYPQVGTQADAASRMVFEFPSGNVVAGSYAADAKGFRTRVDYVGGDLGGQSYVGAAYNTAAMDAGYPYRAEVHQESSVLNQDTLDAKAQGRLAQINTVPDGYTLELDGLAEPRFGSYALGDHVRLRIRHGNVGVPRERDVRIIGWSVKPNPTGGERVTPTFAEVG